MKPALLLVDIQNDYFPGGRMPLVEMNAAAAKVQKLLENCRSQGLPIFHVQHLSQRPNAGFFIPNTPGAEIHPMVQPEKNEIIIIKHYPNSFRKTELQDKLQQHKVDQLIICGAMSHMCIDSTVRAAYDLGYHCVVVSDACATKDLAFDNQSLSTQQVQSGFMAALNGIFAEVISLQDYLTGVHHHANYKR